MFDFVRCLQIVYNILIFFKRILFYYITRGPENVFSKKHVMVSQGPIDKIEKTARLPARVQHIAVQSSSYAIQ